ncbi:conserved hypothetical protein [Culex quinquefasciatus]|uniref:Protein kinase domain-containing protein n=1 Tax=Culex quinquefasciatus TaxID=7176 RepID=B0XBI3_CULQU|nr:conserved hypothetical protein [Culex quinquefasciatus]|eukprot:XP_001867005.1 conserved hypothetical protein [Culex quinquefasciatus]
MVAFADHLDRLGRRRRTRVCIVQKRDSGNLFAMKYVSRNACIGRGALGGVLKEVELLASLEHPFLVNLWFSFQAAQVIVQSVREVTPWSRVQKQRSRGSKKQQQQVKPATAVRTRQQQQFDSSSCSYSLQSSNSRSRFSEASLTDPYQHGGRHFMFGNIGQ